MSYLTKIAAAIAAAAILFLSPGAHAVIPDDTSGAGRSYADDRRTNAGQAAPMECPEAMIPTFCRHYGLATEETTVPGGRKPVVDEPDSTGQIIGWSAAGVAVVSAGVAGVLLIRRRHHTEVPHAA